MAPARLSGSVDKSRVTFGMGIGGGTGVEGRRERGGVWRYKLRVEFVGFHRREAELVR